MIRNYKEEDFPSLAKIAKLAWKDIFAGYKEQIGPELFGLVFDNKYQDKEYQLRIFLEKPPEQCLVCERNGKVAGFITFVFDRDRKIGIIGNNAADLSSNEKGIGQELYAAALERFRSEGMKTAMVNTGLDSGHERARKAYQRAGFSAHTDSITYYMKL